MCFCGQEIKLCEFLNLEAYDKRIYGIYCIYFIYLTQEIVDI
jgi:hypothetical protein